MKTKGFTIIELVVACTLLLILSTIATTSTYNFVQATANLKSEYTGVQDIMALHSALVNAKMNYATDLAVVASQSSTTASEVEQEIKIWNGFAAQNDSADLIGLLINPGFTGLPLAHPGGSYLPTSRNVPVITSVNGNPVTTYVVVQIININSLLEAYQLTDNGTPTGNIDATISVGTMLDVANGIRPILPVIDWKSGTPQEIQY
jgi:prepilin-type N-terminal cleavage/methylation domain-containing protein